MMKFCIHIDIDKMYPMRLLVEFFAKVQILKKSEAIAK